MRVALVTATALALASCSGGHDASGPPRELRSSAQAMTFVADVARGNSLAKWRLASVATSEAARAWQDRHAIQDMGTWLRNDGRAWACELVSRGLEMHFNGPLSASDRHAMAELAGYRHAPMDRVGSLIEDTGRLSPAELRRIMGTVCR